MDYVVRISKRNNHDWDRQQGKTFQVIEDEKYFYGSMKNDASQNPEPRPAAGLTLKDRVFARA